MIIGIIVTLYVIEFKADIKSDKKYDYNIDILNDTMWLYNGDGILLIKGRYDSLPDIK